jgi:hypothetical protein
MSADSTTVLAIVGGLIGGSENVAKVLKSIPRSILKHIEEH